MTFTEAAFRIAIDLRDYVDSLMVCELTDDLSQMIEDIGRRLAASLPAGQDQEEFFIAWYNIVYRCE